MEKWEFPRNDSKEEEGLADAGIETFRDAALPSLARESSQNSMDAALIRWEPGVDPVHVVFSAHLVEPNEIPGLDQLQASLQACLDKAIQRELKKEKQFFTRALKVTRGRKIPVLCVEDYATTGLKGPAEEGTPFHALVRATGISQKSNSDAGGSFGIGKNAAFAVSDLHTVFYSTRYLQDDGSEKILVQGKSILISRKENGCELRAKGYWGEEDYNAVEDASRLPAWLVRKETGTTVASIGFNGDSKNWAAEILESLIRNFFAAIHEGRVRFTVKLAGKKPMELSGVLLEKLFANDMIVKAADDGGRLDALEFSKHMFAALTTVDDSVTIHAKEFPELGGMRLRIMQGEGLPKRVGILRNGMYITDNLAKFGHPLLKFPMSRDFIAVVEPADARASANLREMENPRHDSFSEERIEDEGRRRKLRTDMRALGKWIRGVVREQTREVVMEKVQLTELSDFFASPDESEQIPDGGKAGSNPERITVRPVSQKSRPQHGAGPAGEDGGSGGKKKSKNKGGKTSGPQRGSGRGAAGGRGGKSISYSRFRNMLGDRTGLVRNIILVPEETAEAVLELTAVGVSSNEPLNLRKLNGAVCKKSPVLQLQEGVAVELHVELDEPYQGPVRVVLARRKSAEELIDEN